VRIFNEHQVDEIMVLDIDATAEHRPPNMEMISNLASECRMPLCYGGGVKTIDQIRKIIELGVEKVSLSSEAISFPSLVEKAATYVGSQSIVVTLDVKKKTFGYSTFVENGGKNTGNDPVQMAREFQDRGAGEIVINSIDNDGEMTGYDSRLIELIHNSISIPMTVLGGAGSLGDLGELFKKFGVIGAGAGSLFVFKGIYRAVLINYPNVQEKEALYSLI